MDLKVGVENDGAAVGAKLLQKRSWKERALAFANNGFRQPLGLEPFVFAFSSLLNYFLFLNETRGSTGLYLECCLTRGGLRRRGMCSDEDC
ncbi:hypothetical protein Goklo_017891 [Gossypium klotzschianum]|uniref:Uncharacterized protein n=2 Tax=Gossypium TaxID=3633 RepID=A0A7J8UJP3_9ROSI|nr:hypothetical protein [Gossypium klotzschianum]